MSWPARSVVVVRRARPALAGSGDGRRLITGDSGIANAVAIAFAREGGVRAALSREHLIGVVFGHGSNGYGPAVPRSSSRIRRPGARQHILMVMLVMLLAACAGPTVTADGYRVKTAGALQDISSALATAALTMQLEQHGRMTLALTDTSISQAESDAASAQSSWQTRQPPTAGALVLHDQAEQSMQDAVSALQDLRIAYRRGDADGISRALNEIDKASGEIDQALQKASG